MAEWRSGLVAEEAVGEADELLGGVGGLVGRRGRIGDCIDKSGVHGGQARGVWVADPGCVEWGALGRCGASGEEVEAVAFGEAGEIDEDVDRVALDLFVCRGCGEVGDVAPLARERAEAGGGGVGAGEVGVAGEVDPLAIVMGKQGLDETGDGVLAEVAGD